LPIAHFLWAIVVANTLKAVDTNTQSPGPGNTGKEIDRLRQT